MKTVLVTGATGFIGNYVTQRLLKDKYTVIATSSSPEKVRKYPWFGAVEYIPLDLKMLDPEKDYFQYFREPDILIHLAWPELPNYKSPVHLEQNLPDQFSFLENLIRNGLTDVNITGTCFEYGMREGQLSETMPSDPSNAYAIAKDALKNKLVGLAADYPFALKWIRLFYMYGKGQNPNSLLSQLQAALETGARTFNMSPGDQLRDYLPVETVADYIVRISTQGSVTGIINCCSGAPIMVKDLVREYLKNNHRRIELNLGYYPYSDIEPRNFWGDNSKLKSIIDKK